MKQIDLSNATSLHPSTISRFVSGERRRWETAKKIAIILSREPAFLMEATPEQIQEVIECVQPEKRAS
jgi:hypothetical protein